MAGPTHPYQIITIQGQIRPLSDALEVVGLGRLGAAGAVQLLLQDPFTQGAPLPTAIEGVAGGSLVGIVHPLPSLPVGLT